MLDKPNLIVRLAVASPLLVLACLASAQSEPATRPANALTGAPSRIVAVTVYQSGALVTREVTTPQGAGIFELAVGPLPASTAESSLYSEGNAPGGLRVLTTRYRTTVLHENTEKDVAEIDATIKKLENQTQVIQQQISTAQQNLQLMSKMEEFTSASMKTQIEKGQLSAKEITELSNYIINQRSERATNLVELQQKLQDLRNEIQYQKRLRQQAAAGSDKTIRQAVVVVDKANAGPATVRLNYLVTAAAWHPSYKLRVNDAKPETTLEYMAAIAQQSGEDWKDVDVVLSTAEPMLSAAPPELAMLEVGLVGKGTTPTISVNGKISLNPRSLDNRGLQYRMQREAQALGNSNNNSDANQRWNDAAALGQADELTVADVQQGGVTTGLDPATCLREGQSVTFHLERKLIIPWRDEEQVIEVARLNMKPDFFYKAVPVITAHVYRLANLKNDSKFVILPGEVNTYIDTDFVGRATLPLVAIGESFTAGLGVDPQLQVQRTLMDKSRTTQGGNQVQKFNYRIAISSYKSEAVKMQVWDRLPHSETDQVTVTLVEAKPSLSTDATYQRNDRPKNLLRWDITVEPGQAGEKAQTIAYEFRMEHAKEATIGNFSTK